MEIIAVLLFCAGLITCLALDISLIAALAAGFVVFSVYGRLRGFAWKALFRAAWNSVKTIRELIITFILIGMLTALWRASGTIPVIICYAAKLIHPSVFLMMAFLLCCAVSVLTGSSFCTAATMGVICAAMGRTMEVQPMLVGGAVLAGSFFGDRCSPVSTSALLVATVSGTDMHKNLRAMARGAVVPFLLSCGLFLLLGALTPHGSGGTDLGAVFAREVRLHWSALLPALVIPVLALLRAPIRTTMAVSILIALPLCFFLQDAALPALLRSMLLGYSAADAAAAPMMDGGGILSMLEMTVIVAIAASYSGIFRMTGIFNSAKRVIAKVSARTSPFCAVLCTTVLTAMISCNQSLPIMIGHQLCSDLDTPEAIAIDLEDSAVIVSPLVPWTIASTVPLAMIGAPTVSVLAALYLWLQPLWHLALSLRKKK